MSDPKQEVRPNFIPIESLMVDSSSAQGLAEAIADRTRPREPGPRPPWIKVTVHRNAAFEELEQNVREHNLHTVCEEARCPNIYECWSRGTATFMLMGDVCSRHCGFCSVRSGQLLTLDPTEPASVAETIDRMGILHAVITSVNRDDLADGGSAHIAATIRAVRQRCPQTTIEMLVPDFQGNLGDVDQVIDADPEVFAHNTETVPRLYERVRPEADYQQTLDVLRHAAERRDAVEACRTTTGLKFLRVKSGIMVGLGETREEVEETLTDLRAQGVDVVTIGQYLAPTARHLPVERFVTPSEFDGLKTLALALGFAHVESGPLVRSSYRAERALHSMSSEESSKEQS
jgi:lipoic acid synthetase